MDKLGDRDLVLLRHRPDVDYADVFGGPPMRSYSYQNRRSLASCRHQPFSRFALATEVPAFGGLFGPTQRSQLGDDFFSDIFPGSDSLSSTQWNLDHSPFLSPLPPQLRFEISSPSTSSPSCPSSRFNYLEDQRQNYVEPLDAADLQVKDCLPLKDEMHRNQVRGRVKEFIAMFKFESSTKVKSIYEGGKRKPITKSSLKSKIDVQVNNSTPKPVAEMKVAPCTKEVTYLADSASKMFQVQESFEDKIPNTYISSNVHITTDSSSEKNNTLGPSSDSTEESIEKYNPEDLDGCLVEQLSQELTETHQVGFLQNQINAANAKIMEWSKGREGNIRSLLSTLQYVLWPESGWKPIRLSDIIEGTSVKKAYQKALLCLHPDKLQQRSAAEHQKYIAEKVFDILQESWNQFNSVSLF